MTDDRRLFVIEEESYDEGKFGPTLPAYFERSAALEEMNHWQQGKWMGKRPKMRVIEYVPVKTDEAGRG